MEENGRGINSSNNDGQGQLGQEKRASKLEDVRDQKDRNTGRLCEGTKGLTPVSTGKGKRRLSCSRGMIVPEWSDDALQPPTSQVATI